MVAGLYTQNAPSEDESSVWAAPQTNYTAPASTASPEQRTRKSHSAARRHAVNTTQNETQNSINTDTSSSSSSGGAKARGAGPVRRWSEHVDAQAAVSFNSLLWNGNGSANTAEAPRKTATTTAAAAAASPRGSRAEKSKKSSKSLSSPSSKKDDSFYRRITEWDLNNLSPATSPNSACDREVQAAVKLTASVAHTTSANVLAVIAESREGKEGEGAGAEECGGSRNSSPALSASSESKQSANSPNSPPLDVQEEEEEVEVGVQAALSNTGVSNASPALVETLPLSAAVVEATSPLSKPSFITPCGSFTASASSSASDAASPLASPAPTFTMADVAAALRSCPEGQHPFLDMQYQRNVREHERAQDHLNQQVVQSFQSQFSGQQQAAAFKCLLNAAHRRQYQQCMSRDTTTAAAVTAAEVASEAAVMAGARAPSSVGRWGPRQRRLINRQWRMTAEQAECDLYREGLGAVQRKLSCMCLFNPDTDVRVYDENCNMREQRCYRQHKLLIRLQRQRVRGGNPYFLEETK